MIGRILEFIKGVLSMADYYRIRLDWNGGKWDKTQKGAYVSLEQAQAQCTQELIDLGYKVFSPTGEIVYPIYYNETAQMMYDDGVISDREYWSEVLDGNISPNIENLETVFNNYSKRLRADKESGIEKIVYNGVNIYKVPVELFKVKWLDKTKRSGDCPSYFNAGYFGNFAENGIKFTLPVGNLVADINESEVDPIVMHYLKERRVENGKLYFSSSQNVDAVFRKSSVSTLCIYEDNTVDIQKLNVLPGNVKYAISGAPVIYNGEQYKNITDEGWGIGVGRATYHIFVGTKANEPYVYVFVYKTTTPNCFTSSEVYNKFYDFGFTSLIKLDGGGSAYAKVNGVEEANTSENRQINNIIVIGE
jgi:hypothetical protein